MSDADRNTLLRLLERYRSTQLDDAYQHARILSFVRDHPRAADRELEHGHLTASAWVVNGPGSKVLLMHHQKLGIWLQPGGHADGEFALVNVARREVKEETGLDALPLDGTVFDLDVHQIPEYQGIPAHLHYDVRFVFVADDQQPIRVNNESRAVRWVPFSRVEELTAERSLLRMREKWIARQESAWDWLDKVSEG